MACDCKYSAADVRPYQVSNLPNNFECISYFLLMQMPFVLSQEHFEMSSDQ